MTEFRFNPGSGFFPQPAACFNGFSLSPAPQCPLSHYHTQRQILPPCTFVVYHISVTSMGVGGGVVFPPETCTTALTDLKRSCSTKYKHTYIHKWNEHICILMQFSFRESVSLLARWITYLAWIGCSSRFKESKRLWNSKSSFHRQYRGLPSSLFRQLSCVLGQTSFRQLSTLSLKRNQTTGGTKLKQHCAVRCLSKGILLSPVPVHGFFPLWPQTKMTRTQWRFA